MLYLAGMQLKWFGVGLLAASPVLYYMLWMVPFRRARMETFIHPELDPLGKGFHITQSLIAVGTGGLSGLGLMEGRQKFGFLPEAWARLHLRQHLRRAGTAGSAGAGCALLRSRLSRTARRVPLHRPLRPLSRLWAHLCGAHPGLLQHQRCPCSGAHQGDHAPVHLLRRNVALLHPGRNGCAVEHYA